MNKAPSEAEIVEREGDAHPTEENFVEAGLTLGTIGLLVVAVGLATAGQLLLKSGMTEIGEITSLGTGHIFGLVRGVATTWQTFVGLMCFGGSSVFWLVILSRLPLSTAYPFVALSYLIILAVSAFVLHERPPILSWMGASFIMLGIVLVGFGGFGRGS